MYKRDFGILVLSVVALLYALSNEGSFSFRKAWMHSLGVDGTFIDELDVLPLPVVADLNADGTNEVVVSTHDCKIQVIRPQPPGREGSGFAHARVMSEVSLLPDRIRICTGRRAVALAVGSLDPPPADLVRRPPKQVVVVVTSGWHVLCFDHNLNLLWETSLALRIPHHAVLHEVAVTVSNHTMRAGDLGSVLVGGSLKIGLLQQGEAITGDFEDGDELSAEMNAEQDWIRHARSAVEGADLDEDVGEESEMMQHFSLYALDGRTGDQRWTHTGKDFHRDAGELRDALVPQHNYRLEASSLEARHYGEASCRQFRESLLAVMPHSWQRRSDSRMMLAHFRRQREGKGAQKSKVANSRRAQGTPRETPGTTPRLVSFLGDAHKSLVSGAPHSTGSPHKQGGRNSGAGGAARPSRITRNQVLHGTPNVVVAFLAEGVQVFHLYSGKMLCQLHLPRNGLHVDLDGDGMLDHIQAFGSQAGGDGGGVGRLQHCVGMVTSGIPPVQHVFNGSICRHTLSANRDRGFGSRAFGRSMEAPLEVALPAMLPAPGVHGRYNRHRRRHALALFMNSRGEVTAYDNQGTRVWQLQAGTSWIQLDGEPPARQVAPSLQALPLHDRAVPTAALAAGAHSAAILSEHGHRLHQLDLPAPPLLPLQIVDVDGDGWNDILLLAQQGVLFGYTQVRHAAGVPFTALVGCLLIAMGVVYFTRQVPAPVPSAWRSDAAPKRRTLRGSERID